MVSLTILLRRTASKPTVIPDIQIGEFDMKLMCRKSTNSAADCFQPKYQLHFRSVSCAESLRLRLRHLVINVLPLHRHPSKQIDLDPRDTHLFVYSCGGAPNFSAAEGSRSHQRETRAEKGEILEAAMINPLITSGHTISGDRMQWQMVHELPVKGGETCEADGSSRLTSPHLTSPHQVCSPFFTKISPTNQPQILYLNLTNSNKL